MSKKNTNKNTTKKELEDWLDKLPDSVRLNRPIDVVPLYKNIQVFGSNLPELVSGGYDISITLNTNTWDEKKSEIDERGNTKRT